MAYDYTVERPKLFTEEGQRALLAVADAADRLIAASGAVMMENLLRSGSSNDWMMIAAVDRLVELGRLREIVQPEGTWGQYRVFVAGRNARGAS